MITRYAFVKLSDEHATPAGRAEVADVTRRTLAAVPGTLGVTVGVPACDHDALKWDLSIAVRFARFADIAPYRVDPAHRRYVDEFLAPRMVVIKAWNFETDD
jgi:hypothetical protein